MKNTFALFLLLAALSMSVQAQDEELSNDDCMTCHEEFDPDSAKGKPRNLTIDFDAYTSSVHGQGDVTCIGCHIDIKKLPHPEKLAKANCRECHEDEVTVYETSVHARANAKQQLDDAADCAACHGTHAMRAVIDPLSPVNHHNLAATCIKCHEDQALTERHKDMPAPVEIQSYMLSVHGRSNLANPESTAATCNNCHGWHDTQAANSPAAKISRGKVIVTCGQCHQQVVEDYYGGAHGRLAKEGNPDVVVCTDCHGEHQIRSPEDRQSTVSRFNIAETCARCHEDPRIVSQYRIAIASPSSQYRESAHGKALLGDKRQDAAACQDCHGHHTILGGHDPKSKVHRANIAGTCAACHQSIQEEYQDSVHGQAFARNENESPVCTDCHGEHAILSHLDPLSPVYATRLAKDVCGRCHDSLVINRKYGLPGERISTYEESYHGLASTLGDSTVANCASCHGVHRILSHNHPESMIHPQNLQKTCGACHPGASPEFVSGLVHVSRNSREHLVLFWIRRLYVALIVACIGGMLLHNLIIIFRHVREKLRRQRQQPSIRRFPTVAVTQHMLMTVTFFVLIVTGFSLSYPSSFLGGLVRDWPWLGEHTRSTIHRIAGLALAVTLLWHVLTMVLTRRGRDEVRALTVTWQDLLDIPWNLAHHLGWCKSKPRYDRYNYVEKSEYWALLWGGAIMIVTGLVMWFPVVFTSFFGLSRVWIDASTVIHFYEAWLASLAILVWHFFFVVFHPNEYPMSTSWITGKMSIEEMKEHHPLELERLQAQSAAEEPAAPASALPNGGDAVR